jgi:hypothetical protein
MAVLCYMEEEQCRSLQPFQYKKHKCGQFPADRDDLSMSTLSISSSFRKDRQEGFE